MKKILFILFTAFLVLTGSLSAQNDCPVWEWADDIKQPHNTISIIHMEADSIGNQYVLGSFNDSAQFGINQLHRNPGQVEYFLAKRNQFRIWEWGVIFSLSSTSHPSIWQPPSDFFLDKTGNITITGEFGDTAQFGPIVLSSNNYSPSLFVARFNTKTQQWHWAKRADGPLYTIGQALATDNTGNSYLLGSVGYSNPSAPIQIGFDTINLQVDSSTSFLAKIDSSGNWQWVRAIGSNSYYYAYGGYLTVDPSGNPIMAGYFNNQVTIGGLTATSFSQTPNIFIVKLNPAGQGLWLKVSTDTSQYGAYKKIDNIDVDTNGDIYLSGFSSGSFQFGSFLISNSYRRQGRFLAKLSNTGQWKWANLPLEQWVSFSSTWSFQKFSCTNELGETYLFGFATDSITLGSDTLRFQGWKDGVYIAKIDSSGNARWIGHAWDLPTYRGPNHRLYSASSTNKYGEVYVAGSFYNDMQFGLHTLPFPGEFIAKIKPDSSLVIKLPKDTVVYCGDSITLSPISSSVSQLNYQWSPAHGLSDAKSYAPKASPNSTTIYTVVATSMDGCTDSAQIVVRRDSTSASSPTASIVTSTGGNLFCNNNGITLSTWGTYKHYMWSNGDTSATTIPARPGVYSVVTMDSLGCYQTGKITLNAPKTIIAPNKLLCQNDSVSLFINTFGLDSLRWNNGHNGSSIYASQPGTYWVTIYRGGCIYTDSVKVSLFTDTANARFHHKANLLQVSFSPVSIGVKTGRWSFGDGTFSNSIVDTHSYAAPGTYLVCFTATDICGFTTQHCDSVTVSLIGLPEIKPKATFSIYPNPTKGILNIESDEKGNHTLKIIDLTGKVLLDRILENDSRWEINLSHLPQGYYLIRIDNHTSTFVKL